LPSRGAIEQGCRIVMLRDPRIISLYDKPMYPRRASAYRDDPPGYGTPFLACTSIVVFTLGFFWLYDTVMHRDVPFVPALTQPAVASSATGRTLAAAPAPDMKAPAVMLANSDAALSAVAASTKHDDVQDSPKTAELPRKKKIARPLPHIPAEAAQAFASGSMLDQRPVW
jgi:hypothetical protein